MTHPLLAKCKPYFAHIPEHVLQTLLLVCSAIVLARSTNLNILKDYLPQLLDNQKTKPLSHYKRLIRFFEWTKPNQLTNSILGFIFRFLEGRYTYLIMDATTAPAARLASWRQKRPLAHALHPFRKDCRTHLLTVRRCGFNWPKRDIATRRNGSNCSEKP